MIRRKKTYYKTSNISLGDHCTCRCLSIQQYEAISKNSGDFKVRHGFIFTKFLSLLNEVYLDINDSETISTDHNTSSINIQSNLTQYYQLIRIHKTKTPFTKWTQYYNYKNILELIMKVYLDHIYQYLQQYIRTVDQKFCCCLSLTKQCMHTSLCILIWLSSELSSNPGGWM